MYPLSHFLLKTCGLECLIRYDTIQWWTELSYSRRFCPYLNTGLGSQVADSQYRLI